MRDYKKECDNRIAFIQAQLQQAGAEGIVYGNSGGKDSVLVGILCKMACPNVLGVVMPCQSKRNFGEDMEHALTVAKQYEIETITVDLSDVKTVLCRQIENSASITPAASANIAPRLRMTTLYTIAQSRNSLVAGTGNRSERFMGYFTKWGDGACDFNPIADLTVTEIYEFLRYLKAPEAIITKAPSAGLFEGQTDEQEMGVTYAQIDHYLFTGEADSAVKEKLEQVHRRTAHKLQMPQIYQE